MVGFPSDSIKTIGELLFIINEIGLKNIALIKPKFKI